MTLEDIFLIMRHDRNEFDKIFENGQFSLKNLTRNPTGFRRWDEWLGVMHG